MNSVNHRGMTPASYKTEKVNEMFALLVKLKRMNLVFPLVLVSVGLDGVISSPLWEWSGIRCLMLAADQV